MAIANFVGLFFISAYTKLRNFVVAGENGVMVAVIFFFGTILHEISHLLMVWATLSRATSIDLVPRMADVKTDFGLIERRWTLGGVTYIPRSKLAYFPAGMAPLLLIVPAFIVYSNWLTWFEVSWVSIVSLYVVVYLLLFSSIPSPSDFRIAFEGNGWAVWILIIAVTAAIYNFHIKELIDVISI